VTASRAGIAHNCFQLLPVDLGNSADLMYAGPLRYAERYNDEGENADCKHYQGDWKNA
jgi:hypothetical protein